MLEVYGITFPEQISPIEQKKLLRLVPPARLVRAKGRKLPLSTLVTWAMGGYAIRKHLGTDAVNALCYTEQGAPYLDGYSIHISISHSKGHGLFVLSDQPIGCDVETIRPISARITQRMLHPDEDPAQFLAYWTLKEATVKLHGGSAAPFQDMRFRLEGDCAVGAGVRGWLYRQELPGAVVAVVAVVRRAVDS